MIIKMFWASTVTLALDVSHEPRPMVGSEVYSTEVKKTEVFWQRHFWVPSVSLFNPLQTFPVLRYPCV